MLCEEKEHKGEDPFPEQKVRENASKNAQEVVILRVLTHRLKPHV